MRFVVSLAIVCVIATAGVVVGQVRNSNQPAQQNARSADQSEMMVPGDMPKHMQMMNKMMVKHLGKSDAEYDSRFIDMMIPHHEGAVMMARDALKNAKHQELKDMAAKMMKDQQKEIEQLKKWRQEWYGQTSATRTGTRSN